MLGPSPTSKSPGELEAQRQIFVRANAQKRGGKSPLLVANSADKQTMLGGR